MERVKFEDGETTLELGSGERVPWNGIHGEEGKGLFYDCPIKSLYVGRNLSYPKNYKEGISPFKEKTTITELTIGNTVTNIGSSLFRGCTGLTSVIIPNSVTEIGDYAFYHCSGITSLTIPNSVTRIGSSAFDGCSGITSLTIPNSVTRIGSSAFFGCSGITSLTISNSVQIIGESTFRACDGLTNITIPNSVTEIEEKAFWGCDGLTNVTIGNSVEKIGEKAFSDTSLSELYSLNTTPPTIENSNTFDNNHYMTLKVYVPKGSLKAYQEAEGWKNFWNLAEGAPTGINQITTDNNAPSTIYDLQGNKLNSPKRGINITNGKKVMMK